MKITVNFAELSKVLGYSNAVLSDKSVDEKIKNIIFNVSPTEVLVIGYNALTFCRTRLEETSIDGVPEEGWEFQIKASELNKIISSYSNLYKTEVNRIEFEDAGVHIKIIVHEVAKDEADEKLSRDGVFEMASAPILANISQKVKTAFPDGVDLVSCGDLTLYLDALFPLVSNDTSASLGSKLNFAEDYVFNISSSMSAFFQNRLGNQFKDITLGYSSVGFLKKLCEGNENIGVSKTDKFLCIEAGNTQAFMQYNKVKINYKMYIDKKSKDIGIVLDRLYFKDVLKRLGISGAEGKMIVGSDVVTVMNEQFQQDIPLNGIKSGTEGISIKISIPTMEKLILGDDKVFADDLYIYFVPTARGYMLYLQDKTGAWLSNSQVTKA